MNIANTMVVFAMVRLGHQLYVWVGMERMNMMPRKMLLQCFYVVCYRAPAENIRDFHYYNVEALEGELNRALDDNFELQTEISIQIREMSLLRGDDG